MDPYDLIVVGAGIMGSSAAYYAARRDLRVLLLEQHDFLHHLGSSHGESRTIRATYPEPYYPPMVLRAFALWAEAEAEAGYKVLYQTQHLDIGPTTNKSLQHALTNCQPNLIPHQVLDSQKASALFGGAFRVPQGHIAVLSGHAGVIKATKAVAMFQSLATKHGAHLRDRTKINYIKPNTNSSGGVEVGAASGDTFHARKCIVAAGAWTARLLAASGGPRLPIQPLHTTISYWPIKARHVSALALAAGFPTFASYGRPYIYGTPSMEFPGTIKIAYHGGRPCSPENRDFSRSSGEAVETVKKWIKITMPDFVESEAPAMVQSCMYSMTPDGDFIVDFVGEDVVVVGGFSGHGFKLGPVIGKKAVEMAVEGAAAGPEMGWFGIGRFAGGKEGNVKEFEEQVVVKGSLVNKL